jgi:hypothetical protein
MGRTPPRLSERSHPVSELKDARFLLRISIGMVYFAAFGIEAALQSPDIQVRADQLKYLYAASAMGILGLSAILYLMRSIRHAKQAIVHRYGNDARIDEPHWLRPARLGRWLILHVGLCAFLGAGATGRVIDGAVNIRIGSPLAIIFLTCLAIGPLTLAIPAPPRSTAELTEEAEAQADASEPIIEALSAEIRRRISSLDELRRTTELAREISEDHTQVVRESLIEVLRIRDRKQTRQQWLFVFVSFCLGFLVNWWSDPLLKFLR